MEFYISTIAADAAQTARQFGLGLEIAEYCTAWNMDERFPETDASVRRKLKGVEKRILHGPFNELFPCAIDPKARELAAFRYRQAMALAREYGAEKVVLHGGYQPKCYFPCWYTEQSALFWRAFLEETPEDMVIVLENVLEEEPGMLLDILKAVEDPRLRLCLDVGHANAYSRVPVMEWLEACAPYIGHLHIHNNQGSGDSHGPLYQGTVPMARFLRRAGALLPQVSATLEVAEAGLSVRWLKENGFLEECI